MLFGGRESCLVRTTQRRCLRVGCQKVQLLRALRRGGYNVRRRRSAAFGRTSVARRVHSSPQSHRAPIFDSRALDAGANTSRSVRGGPARENQPK